MLFPTHLVAASLGARWLQLSPAAVVAGAALPDLIDKPLGMTGVTGLFHTVGHSALVLGALVVLALVVPGTLVDGRQILAVWVGWASHLALDAVHVVVNGRPVDAQFLLWPVRQSTGQVNLPPVEFAMSYLWSASFFLEVGIWLVAAAVVVTEAQSQE